MGGRERCLYGSDRSTCKRVLKTNYRNEPSSFFLPLWAYVPAASNRIGLHTSGGIHSDAVHTREGAEGSIDSHFNRRGPGSRGLCTVLALLTT